MSRTEAHFRFSGTTPSLHATTELKHKTVDMADNNSPEEQPLTQQPESPADQAGILPPGHWANTLDHEDEALGEDKPDSTVSITSSVLRYRTIHGRTYHSERGNAQYW